MERESSYRGSHRTSRETKGVILGQEETHIMLCPLCLEVHKSLPFNEGLIWNG